jgi:glucose-1-phosphate adenylyltransferase
MDYSQILKHHRERACSLTMAAITVKKEEAAGKLGVLEIAASDRVLTCEEKPQQPKTKPGAPGHALASMGIYVFNISALADALKEKAQDFAKEVIPNMIKRGHNVLIYDFQENNRVEDCVIVTKKGTVSREIVPMAKDSSYWRDVGTIDSYFQASMELLGRHPLFDLQSAQWPIRTHRRPLPPSRFRDGGGAHDSVISDGCLIRGRVRSSILSPRVAVERGAVIERSMVFDNVLIGPRARIQNAIIDKQAVVQPGASIGFDLEEDRKRGCTVTDSAIVVVPKGLTIEPC